MLTTRFFAQVMEGKELTKISITIQDFIAGDFGAGAAMISFGALLGKVSYH